MNLYTTLLTLFTCFALMSCSEQRIGSTSESEAVQVTSNTRATGACPSTRPVQCDESIQPVCAIRDTGVRCITTPCPSSEYVTFNNACQACADKNVSSWSLGRCKN